jgi:hypothetical protein
MMNRRESSPLKLGKQRAVIHMKDSIQLATPRPIDCGYVQAAHRRIEEMRTSKADPLEPPTVFELAEALGERVQKCDLWGRNWRNRVYRVELASGGAALAKQVIMGTDAMLQYQYDQLRVLARLRIPGLRVPKALALLRAKRVFVMEFARGKTIPALVWNRTSGDEVLRACELAGKILARIHMAWTEKICPMPVEPLARDLAATPWKLSRRQQKILESALENLAGAEVSMGQVYYDYKATNLLRENGELFLVDPPDVLRQGVHLWDFSCFRSSLRRMLWRLSLRRPFDRHRAIVRQTMPTFERGYLMSFSERHPKPALFALAAWLFELHRTAVLTTMQKGKVSVARQKMPIARDGSLGNTLATRITLPLLEMEKRWLFVQLARELA